MSESLIQHPEHGAFRQKAASLGRDWERSGGWDLFRFVSPRYSSAADVISGEGAMHGAGRWHLPGSYRLSYTALEPETATAEAFAEARYYQRPLHTPLPKVLVGVRLEAVRVLDLREEALCRTLGVSLAEVRATDWRQQNDYEGREALTQALGTAFAAAGFEAVIVPSAAPGADLGANVLVFPDHLDRDSQFYVVSEVQWP